MSASRLGVPELWVIEKQQAIEVYALRGKRYKRVDRSELLTDLDVAWLASFMKGESQTEAVRAFRKAMRAAKR